MENKFYTIDQIAGILGMHHKTIRKFINEGKLNANKVGKQWRISGHDLSIFMEKNNVSKVNIKSKESMTDYTIGEEKEDSRERINVSTVIDINKIDKDEYTRISNMLIAIMNCKDSNVGKSTINMIYDDKKERLRVMLWGNIEFIEVMLNSISVLIKDEDKKGEN